MKIKIFELRNVIRESLNEGHARITAEEVKAWKTGDWGYVSESDSYEEATREELIEWCLGILQDPTTPLQKLKDTYNLLAKDPMGPRQPSLKDLIRDKFSSK